MNLLEQAFQYIHDSLAAVTTSDVLRYKEYFDPENDALQVVRKCASLYKDAGIELCVRYELSRFEETGAQDFAIELFSFGSF
jgi:hypothetical protein